MIIICELGSGRNSSREHLRTDDVMVALLVLALPQLPFTTQTLEGLNLTTPELSKQRFRNHQYNSHPHQKSRQW
jgi:hypothetical protein